jgi:hypothetical protein
MLFHNEYSSMGNRASTNLQSLVNLYGFTDQKIDSGSAKQHRPEWLYYKRYGKNDACYFPLLIDPNASLHDEQGRPFGPGDLKLTENIFPPNERKNADNKILCIGCSFTAGDPFSSWRDICFKIAKEFNNDAYLKYAEIIESSVPCSPYEYTDPLQTYPSFLGSMLRNYDVWNCGLCGAGSYLHYLYRLKDYVALKPKIVIFQIMEPCRNPSFFLPESVFKNCGYDITTADGNTLPGQAITRINQWGGDLADGRSRTEYYFKMHNEMWHAPRFIVRRLINKDWFYIKKIYDALQCKFIFLINNERYPIGWYRQAKYKSPVNEIINRCKKFKNSTVAVTQFDFETTEDVSDHPTPKRHMMTAEILEMALSTEIHNEMEIHNSEGYNTTFYTT